VPPSDDPSNGGSASDDSNDESHSESRSNWVQGAVFVGIGVEFVGIVVGGLFLGYAIDAYLGTTPVAILVCFVLSLAAVAFHMYKMLDLT
jgi:F0F1-type ATP synthase assembly protein I